MCAHVYGYVASYTLCDWIDLQKAIKSSTYTNCSPSAKLNDVSGVHIAYVIICHCVQYACICTCTYTLHAYTRMYTHTYLCIYTSYIYMCVYICMYVCIYVYMHVRM